MRYFQINTNAPPDTIPAIAPGNVVRFQKREHIITGPNAAPNPAPANDTIPNTELFGSLAMTIQRIATTTTVRRAAIMLALLERFI